MYYIITSISNDAGYKMRFSYTDYEDRSFDEGIKFTDDPNELLYKQHPQGPVQIKIRDLDENDPWPDFVKVPIPFLSKRMYEVLRSAGVNNIDVYPVEIFHADGTLASESDNYVVFNLIGTVTDSELNILADLPENEIQGHLMFRLAELTSIILVHESIKKALEEANISLIDFDNAPKNLYASLMR